MQSLAFTSDGDYYTRAANEDCINGGPRTRTKYQYDNANRLTQIVQGPNVVGLAYDAANRNSSLTLPNGIVATPTFDAANQLLALSYDLSGTHVGDLAYTYDAAGRRITQSGSLATLNVPTSVSSTSYDAANRLTNWGGSVLSYDANGNLTGSGASTFTWNTRNQLVGTSDGGGIFAYDPPGRRANRTVSGVATPYVHDGLNPATVGGSSILAGQGLDDFYAETNASATTSYVSDGLGSTVAASNSSGAIVGNNSYGPYGTTQQSGATATAFQYTGRENDGASNLYYYRNRYYSPSLNRFISQDPIGLAGGVNMYAYVSGDPISNFDPLGLAKFGYRPLGDGMEPFPPGKAPSGPSALDLQQAHEQLWFDDDPHENAGFFAGDGSRPGLKMCGERGEVRSDFGHNRRQYKFFGPTYDDELMRTALYNILPKWNQSSYCLAGQNCQNFADALRNEYARLGARRMVRLAHGSSK